MEIDDLKPKTEEGKVRLWLDRIDVARRYRDRMLDDMGVDRFVKYYAGDYGVRLGNYIAPPINEVFAYVQTLAAILNFRNPAIALNPRKSGSILGARILEQCVSYDWRINNLKDECDLELIDVPLAGLSWHKTGYWNEVIGKNGKVEGLKDEGIFSNRVSWRDIVFNIGSRRPPFDCQWISHRIIKPTSEVKDMYPGNADLKGGAHPSLQKSELKYANFKDDLNYTVLWEIWDKKEKMVYHVAEDYPTKFLKKPSPWPDYVKDFPFDMLFFNSSPDDAFPIPDIKMIEPQILEGIKLFAMALNHVKRWNRQLLIKKGGIDPQEQDKLEKGIDGTFVETNGNPNEIHAVLQYGPLPPDIYAIFNRIDEMKNRIGGLTNTSMGGVDATKTRTAGELEMMQKGSGLRTDKKRDRFERHLESIAKKIIAIRQANFDLEQVIKITGDMPQEIMQAFGDKYDPMSKTITFTKEDIKGEYDVDVQAGSTMALDKIGRMNALTQIIDRGVQMMAAPSIPPFLQVAIMELLKDYEIKSLEDAFNAQTRQADLKMMSEAQAKNVDQEKTQAEAEKRKAQAEQIKNDTAIKGAEALLKAAQLGVLPEFVELGRGMGRIPSDTPPQAPRMPNGVGM